MSTDSSSECGPPSEKTAAEAETPISLPPTTEGNGAQTASTSRQDPFYKLAAEAEHGSHEPAQSIRPNSESNTLVTSSHGPAPPSTMTSDGPVGQTTSSASPHVSVPKDRTKATLPTVVKSVAPPPPRPPAAKSSGAVVSRPQTGSVQLPATIQIPPGMVLVRSNSGQLMFISQQALANAQRAITNPGVIQPSVATVVRKPGSTSVIRVCPPISTPKPTYAIGTIPQRPGSVTGPTLQRPSAAGRVSYRPNTAVGTSLQRPSSTMGTITQRPCSATGTSLQKPSCSVGTLPQRPISAVGTVTQRLSSAAAGTTQHITSTSGTTIIKATGAACTAPAVISTSRPGGLAPRILPANVPTKLKATPPDTLTPQTIENVKKCKNFLVTLMKLASSGSHSSDMGINVRNLVKSLLDGKLEAEEFTEKIYSELKSSPQPYLVTFLKRSLPAVRQLTPNSQLFIQQCEQPSPQPAASVQASTCTSTSTCTATQPQPTRPATARPTLVIQTQQDMVIKKPVTSKYAAQGGGLSDHFVLRTTRTPTAGVIAGQSSQITKSHTTASRPNVSLCSTLKESAGTFRDEDDINDVASMAGVSVNEERARILATGAESVGLVIRSCQDEPFLCPAALRTHIIHTALSVGVSSLEGDVVGLVSHATEERLRDLLGKLTVTAQHRHMQLKDCWQYQQGTDVRGQLRFLEQVERLQQQRREAEEREMLLRIAKSRSNREEPEQQCLKQKAKEMQQLELAQAQHRQANLAALAAIGPRRKRPLEVSTTLGPRSTPRPVTRVILRDLIFCMEQDSYLSRSLLFYSAMLK